MTDAQVNSWIFLAAAAGATQEPITFKSILLIADGINHAVPTQKELQSAFRWLVAHRFMQKVGNKFEITHEGTELFAQASANSETVLEQWRFLENRFAGISTDDGPAR